MKGAAQHAHTADPLRYYGPRAARPAPSCVRLMRKPLGRAERKVGMDKASLMAGDRATLHLCVAGVTFLVIVAFTKLLVGGHEAEYSEILRSRGSQFIILAGLGITLLAVWLFGNVIGLVLAYRMRRHLSIRFAAIAASVGLIAAVVTGIGIPVSSESRLLWTVLVWLPLVATVVVFMSSVAWVRERQVHDESKGGS